MAGNPTYQPNIALLAGLVWLVVAGQLLWLDWTSTAMVLGDTDDVMRLVEVRAFVAGRGWFDLHEPRLQPPLGYDTHWSRLIDAGLAGVFLIFRSFADAAVAERLMRVVWPLLWIGPAIAGTIAIAWRLGGRAASFVVLLLLVFGLPAFFQFKPGRIDHHDIQITLALLTLAAAIWADRVRWAAWVAGALSGLALGIGLEGMPFIVVAGGTFAARYVLGRDHAAALAQYGLSAAASVAFIFAVSAGPDHWMRSACDAIAINLAVPAVLGGLALGAAGLWIANERRSVRCIAIAAALGLAAAAFVLIEPRCLGGPLAMVDPAVRPVWLAHVREVQSLLSVIHGNDNPMSGYAIAAYPLTGIIAAIVLARDIRLRRDSGFITAAIALIVAIMMTMVAIRASPYTIWLGVPFVAAVLLRLFDWLKLARLPARVLVTLAFTPAVISFGAVALIEAIASQPANINQRDEACFQIENYAPLARLPAGLVVSDVDYGPFLLALTPHSVIAAPYHRLSYGIVASHRAFASPPAEAREILRQAKTTYVMTCGVRAPRDLTEAQRVRSLWAQLAAGAIPDWLEPIPQTGPFAVYRFKP